MNRLLKSTSFQTAISGLLIAVTLISIISPDWEFVQKGTEYTVHLMIGFLGLGLLFLSLDIPKLLFVSFACCASICIFLKNASNEHLHLPDLNMEPKVSIAHLNTANIEQGFDELVDFIDDMDPDIISIQEVTPEWGHFIKTQLKEKYPYQNLLIRIDPYGMCLISKTPFIKIDTFNHNNIPNLLSTVSMGDQNVSILSSYIVPDLGKSSKTGNREHLDLITRKITSSKNPVISLGDFNMVYWQNEIRDFRKNAELENSRRDFTPLGFRIPHDHIFYSAQLECTRFAEVNNDNSNHFGILGTFQLKTLKEYEGVKAALGYLDIQK